MSSMSRRRFLTLMVAGLGAAACGTQSDGTATTVAPTASSIPPPTTAPTTSTTAPVTSTTSSTTTTSAMPPPEQIDVICKEAWGALPVAGDFTPHAIDRITIHHTAVLLEENALAPARLRQHQAFHQSRGWPDLAYHFMIDAAGNVYEGRPVDAVGDTGTDYDPTGHLLICCEGNFDEQELPPPQYETLIQMVAWGAAQYGVAPASVQGHRDVAATNCPGDRLYGPIADGTLAGDVAAVLGEDREPTVICGEAAFDRVAEIEGSGA
ncbi:MAG: peptidoglycan recognition family protein [Acidimicrobiia bacterium]|nr:peptidoglycan recognition family protein [Acidimicrobiia bacterium]